MSIKLMQKAWECPVNGNDLLILLSLCDFASDEGELFPSLKTIQNKTKVSKGTLSYVLRAYEEIGVITREKRVRDNGSNTSTFYKILKLNFTLEEYKKAYQQARNYNPKNNKSSHCEHPQEVHIVNTPSHIVNTQKSHCEHLEPSILNHQYEPSIKSISNDIPKSELDIYINNWNFFATQYGLNQIHSLTQSRVQKLKTRLTDNQNFFSIFEQACVLISKSDFLKGKNKNSWKVSFDWIIENDKNIFKILEGNYNRQESIVKNYLAMREQGYTVKDLENMGLIK